MQGVIKRATDGSTKAVHQRLYDALKGIGDDDTSQQCMMTEGAAGQLRIQSPKKRPLRGLTPDETKDVSARFVCLIDSSWSIVDHKSLQGDMVICDAYRSRSLKFKDDQIIDN